MKYKVKIQKKGKRTQNSNTRITIPSIHQQKLPKIKAIRSSSHPITQQQASNKQTSESMITESHVQSVIFNRFVEEAFFILIHIRHPAKLHFLHISDSLNNLYLSASAIRETSISFRQYQMACTIASAHCCIPLLSVFSLMFLLYQKNLIQTHDLSAMSLYSKISFQIFS